MEASHSSLEFQTYRWLGLLFDVPREWEIVRHATLPERGSLTLVDRRRQRLEVSWTDCPTAPDLDRLTSDFRSQNPGESEEFREGPWHGLKVKEAEGSALTRAVQWDSVSRRLIEASFLVRADASEDEVILRRVLEGFAFSSDGRDEPRVAAFDLDVTAPTGFRLHRASVRPADVSFEFSQPALESRVATKLSASAAPRASVRRVGMVRDWFNGNLEAFVRRDEQKLKLTFEEREHAGHRALYALGKERGRWIPKALGWLNERRLFAFHCANRNAIYLVKVTSRPGRGPSVDDFRVHCCGEKP